MKRTLLVSLALITFFAAFGQYRGLPVRTSGSTKVNAITNISPGGILQHEQVAVPPAITGFRDLELEIGTTNFDIQTTQHRTSLTAVLDTISSTAVAGARTRRTKWKAAAPAILLTR
jgi:hypothetical protein